MQAGKPSTNALHCNLRPSPAFLASCPQCARILPPLHRLSQERPPCTRQVLIDFGYAHCDPGAIVGLAGTPEYAAPEVLSWLSAGGIPYTVRELRS